MNKIMKKIIIVLLLVLPILTYAQNGIGEVTVYKNNSLVIVENMDHVHATRYTLNLRRDIKKSDVEALQNIHGVETTLWFEGDAYSIDFAIGRAFKPEEIYPKIAKVFSN